MHFTDEAADKRPMTDEDVWHMVAAFLAINISDDQFDAINVRFASEYPKAHKRFCELKDLDTEKSLVHLFLRCM